MSRYNLRYKAPRSYQEPESELEFDSDSDVQCVVDQKKRCKVSRKSTESETKRVKHDEYYNPNDDEITIFTKIMHTDGPSTSTIEIAETLQNNLEQAELNKIKRIKNINDVAYMKKIRDTKRRGEQASREEKERQRKIYIAASDKLNMVCNEIMDRYQNLRKGSILTNTEAEFLSTVASNHIQEHRRRIHEETINAAINMERECEKKYLKSLTAKLDNDRVNIETLRMKNELTDEKLNKYIKFALDCYDEIDRCFKRDNIRRNEDARRFKALSRKREIERKTIDILDKKCADEHNNITPEKPYPHVSELVDFDSDELDSDIDLDSDSDFESIKLDDSDSDYDWRKYDFPEPEKMDVDTTTVQKVQQSSVQQSSPVTIVKSQFTPKSPSDISSYLSNDAKYKKEMKKKDADFIVHDGIGEYEDDRDYIPRESDFCSESSTDIDSDEEEK